MHGLCPQLLMMAVGEVETSLQDSADTCSVSRKNSSWTMNHLSPCFKTLTPFKPTGICTLQPIPGLQGEFPNAAFPAQPRRGSVLFAQLLHTSFHAGTLLVASCCLGNSPASTEIPTFVDICNDVISQTYPHRHVISFTGITVSTKCN